MVKVRNPKHICSSFFLKSEIAAQKSAKSRFFINKIQENTNLNMFLIIVAFGINSGWVQTEFDISLSKTNVLLHSKFDSNEWYCCRFRQGSRIHECRKKAIFIP